MKTPRYIAVPIFAGKKKCGECRHLYSFEEIDAGYEGFNCLVFPGWEVSDENGVALRHQRCLDSEIQAGKGGGK